MALTAGSLSKVSASDVLVKLLATAPTGGTTPYIYAWYRSVIAGFTPGTATALAGATALALSDSQVVPGTTYFYKQVQTDSNATPLLVTPTGLTVNTLQPSQNISAFQQSSQLGVLDLLIGASHVVSVQIDSSQVAAMRAGQAVKIVDSADGIPKVVACAANTDEVLGFIIFDHKHLSFVAGDQCEIAQGGACMYLYSTTAIARGAQVTLDFAYQGGVASKVTGDKLVGWAYDKAANSGVLIRVRLISPSFALA